MTEPGKPQYVDTLRPPEGIAWTGEKSPLGVSYAFPEWFRWDSATDGMGWAIRDAHGLLWTLVFTWRAELVDDNGGRPMVIRRNQWHLKESAFGWWVELSVPGDLYAPTAYTTTSGVTLRKADWIIRGIDNREGMACGFAPRVRSSVLRTLEDVGEWQQSVVDAGG